MSTRIKKNDHVHVRGEDLKGKIVWIDGWGGVIGEVVSFKEDLMELNLKWSDEHHDIFWSSKDQSFSPVTIRQITVLSSEQVLEKMGDLFKQWKRRIEEEIVNSLKRTMTKNVLSY